MTRDGIVGQAEELCQLSASGQMTYQAFAERAEPLLLGLCKLVRERHAPAWHSFPAELPPERRHVLVRLSRDLARSPSNPPSIVLGYLRYAAGDKNSPYFVTPGVMQVGRLVEAWCDCLPAEAQDVTWCWPPEAPRR